MCVYSIFVHFIPFKLVQIYSQQQQQQSASIWQYSQFVTPQSLCSVLVPLPPGATPLNAQLRVYVQAPVCCSLICSLSLS
uniref:Secreted protein n=1 Tax=Elaeophora elaphi TaxID=1147741 RepID=A0A0R3RP04_9BILA